MPEIKVVTEVAGRVCALPLETGASVGNGDDIAFVEAMKMEIRVASPAAGKLKSILVKVDDVIAEGQAVAVLETECPEPEVRSVLIIRPPVHCTSRRVRST